MLSFTRSRPRTTSAASCTNIDGFLRIQVVACGACTISWYLKKGDPRKLRRLGSPAEKEVRRLYWIVGYLPSKDFRGEVKNTL